MPQLPPEIWEVIERFKMWAEIADRCDRWRAVHKNLLRSTYHIRHGLAHPDSPADWAQGIGHGWPPGTTIPVRHFRSSYMWYYCIPYDLHYVQVFLGSTWMWPLRDKPEKWARYALADAEERNACSVAAVWRAEKRERVFNMMRKVKHKIQS